MSLKGSDNKLRCSNGKVLRPKRIQWKSFKEKNHNVITMKKKNFWQPWNLKGLELGEFGSATSKVPVKKNKSRKGKNRLNKKNPPKKVEMKKNLLAAMSLKGPEVSLDAAHRDAGSASTYVVWFEKKGPHPFFIWGKWCRALFLKLIFSFKV